MIQSCLCVFTHRMNDMVVSRHSGMRKFHLLFFHPFIGMLQNIEGATTDCLNDIPCCTDFGMLYGLCLHFPEHSVPDYLQMWSVRSNHILLWRCYFTSHPYPDIDHILIPGLNWVYVLVCVCTPCVLIRSWIYYDIVSVHVFCAPPVFDVPSQSWKGNVRAQDSQCCSHLCPLMIGQRQSRPNHGRLCHETRTLPDLFFVASALLKPIQLPLLAIVPKCSCYDAGLMGVIQRWRLCLALHLSHWKHLNISLPLPLVDPSYCQTLKALQCLLALLLFH